MRENNENEKIEQSNLILNAMFNAMPDEVFCKDLDKRYIECNKSFEAFIAHTKEEVIGKTFAEVAGDGLVIIKYYDDVDDIVLNEGKTIKQEGVSMSYDGAERFYDITKTPLIKKNADGEDEIFGLLGLMHDVNERYLLIKDLQNLQANLEIALEQANSGSRAKSEFLSRMSHELRTPMNAIMGMAQIVKASDDLEYVKDCIDEIYDNSNHLMRLINNLLEASQGVGALNKSEFSLNSMIESIEARISAYLDRKQQTLNTHIDSSLPKTVVADEKRIAQVIFHLLTNASKFSPETGKVSLKIGVFDDSDRKNVLKISVIDNGIGMSTEVLSSIFDIFEQADGSYTRKYEGVGIGLTLSKYIVETMGGIISVVSEPGEGSEFTFTVPVSLP